MFLLMSFHKVLQSSVFKLLKQISCFLYYKQLDSILILYFFKIIILRVQNVFVVESSGVDCTFFKVFIITHYPSKFRARHASTWYSLFSFLRITFNFIPIDKFLVKSFITNHNRNEFNNYYKNKYKLFQQGTMINCWIICLYVFNT